MKMIELFIDKGADVDEVNNDQLSCLGYLIYKGVQDDINTQIRYFVENFNPDIQIKDKDGDTPFYLHAFGVIWK